MILGKRTHPMIGRLSDLLVSGNRAGFLDVATSPRGPFDYKIQSPRGLKNYELGGVGLGIVAALEKPRSDGGHEVLAKYLIGSARPSRSDPIPVHFGKDCERFPGEPEEMESWENYTHVTIRGPNKCCSMKVYYDGVEYARSEDDNSDVVSMPKQFQARFVEDVSLYPNSDFLHSCHLCMKKLHGKDIYMYRGEKGFCSMECRSRQIMIDECKEQCRSKISRSADVSCSPQTRSPIFSTGILAI